MTDYDENENDITREEQAETNQQMSEEEQKIADKVREKGISKEDAEKERAKEKVEEKTGVNADELAGVARDALMMKDGIERPDADMIQKGVENVNDGHVREMLEHMKDGKVAEDIVKAGLGSEHASTGSGGLEEGAKTVLEKGLEYSDNSKMGEMLAKSCNGGKGIPGYGSLEQEAEQVEQAGKEALADAPQLPGRDMDLDDKQRQDMPSYILAQQKKQGR